MRRSIRNQTAQTFVGGEPLAPWAGWPPFPLREAGPRAVDWRAYRANIRGAAEGRLWSPCQPDRCIGEYQLEHKIGEGGGSIVYAAFSQEDGRVVAIKVPKGEAEIARSRIKSDFRAARRLRHRHVVRMHRLLPIGDRYAAVMEWLSGPSLMEYVRGTLPLGQLPPLARLRLVGGQLAAGLAHMHAAGWVHGDVKPDNVHFTTQGTPRWLDFDLATAPHRPLWMPPPEHVAGTFSYLSPEVIVGQPAAAPADMFSFGRLLSKLVCGRLPSWDPGMGSAVSAARIRQQLPSDTPRELLTLCTQLVHVSPAARPTAAEVYHTLSGTPLARMPVSLQPSDPPPQVSAAASEAMRRADDRKGMLLVIETSQSEHFDLQALVAATRSEEPRLLLAGHCDRREETHLRGFDAILDQLALWIERIPASLRADWRHAAGPALALLRPRLAAAVGVADDLPAAEPQGTSHAACEALVRLLTAIAQERTVVLSIQNLQDLDDDGQRLLVRLVQQMPSAPIVIVATADRRRGRLEYAATLPPTTNEAAPVTLHVGC